MARHNVNSVEVHERHGDRFTHVTQQKSLVSVDVTGGYAGLHYAFLYLSNQSVLRVAVENQTILGRRFDGDRTHPLCFVREDENGKIVVSREVAQVGDAVTPWSVHIHSEQFRGQDNLPTIENITIGDGFLE